MEENKKNNKSNNKKKTNNSTNKLKKDNKVKTNKKVLEKKDVIKETKVENEVKTKPESKDKKTVKNNNDKKNKPLEKTSVVTNNEMVNLIKIILVVTLIFLVFYGITSVVTKNKKESKVENKEVSIQYDEILLGNLFEQSNSDYYVLVTREDDKYLSTYSTYITSYKSKKESIRIYRANLDSGFNKSYLADQSNTNITNIKDLKLSGSTLLKIKNKKIVSKYEGNSKIIEHLKSLLK